MKISNCAQRINELLEELNITQAEFSEKVGIDASTISLYCTGKRMPRQDKIAMICDKYSLNPSWLLGYDVPMKNVPETNRDDRLVTYLLDTEKGKLLVDISETLEDMQADQLRRVLEYAKFISRKE